MHNPAIMYRSFVDLKEWQAFMLETRILEEIYYPMRYHYHAGISDHKDIAVFILDSARVECHDNPKDKRTMCEMVCGFSDNHEYWEIGIKSAGTDTDYYIGVICPNQSSAKGSIKNALTHDRSAYSFTDLNRAIDALRIIIKKICDDEIDPQWLENTAI